MPRQKTRSEHAISTTRIRALLRTARRAAQLGGEFVDRRYRPLGREMLRKGVGDFVTEVDLAAEDLLRRTILAAWPEHGILGEERPGVNLDADFVWILDPVDGTSNFGRGLPIFAVSVACAYRGQPIVAAVHCFPDDQSFSAGIGLGAFRGRRRLQLSPHRLDYASIL